MSLLVSEIMSYDLLTIRVEAPLAQADAEMRLGHVRHLPVVDAGGLLVGMLSLVDVARRMAAQPGATVRDVMAAPVVSVREGTPAADAAHAMRTQRTGCLPVLDAGGRLVGLVTELDFVEVAEKLLSGKPPARRR